jgi:phosphohistidine swiveling domain-containing protein
MTTTIGDLVSKVGHLAPHPAIVGRTGLIPMIAAIVRQVQIVSRMGRLT